MKKLIITSTLAAMLFLSNAIGVLRAQSPDYDGIAPRKSTGISNAGSNAPGVSPAQVPGYGGTSAGGGTQDANLCVPEMDAYTQVELGRFMDFLTTNFQNKSSTSSLLNVAMARYRELRTNIYNKYYTYGPKSGASQYTEGIVPGACIELIDKALAQARNSLKMRSLQTSTVKRTSALINKYQDINNQLATLNRTFVTMKAYLTTFSDKLPCYIQKSCNK